MTARLHRLPTADGAILPALEASITQAKRARREATLAYVTKLRIEAERQFRTGGYVSRDDGQTYVSALEIEMCAVKALLEER